MSDNTKQNIKDKIKAGPATTGSYATSTDTNLTTASAGPEGDDSKDLFPHFKAEFKNDKRRI